MSNVFGWLCLVLVLFSVGAVAGVYLRDWLTGERQQAIKRSEAKLQAEWSALHAAQRLNAAFMEARRAMAEEAIRHYRRPTPP